MVNIRLATFKEPKMMMIAFIITLEEMM